MQMVAIKVPTKELLAQVKATCAFYGAKVRCRKLTGSLNGRIRVVLENGTRDMVRDALVEMGALYNGAQSFTLPESRHAWNGDQINIFFPEAA